MKIGIGITTHNRRSTFIESLTEILRYFPDGSKLAIVDDKSDEALPVSEIVKIVEESGKGDQFFPNNVPLYHPFAQNQGIAAAKNKCLELLDDCDHIFLFDDDTYPTHKDWWRPYVESDEPHLNYIFTDFVNKSIGDCVELYSDSKIRAYSHVRGCMIYIDRSVLDVVGGMDIRYGKAMNEHVDWSNRIYNAGLTSFRYMDVANSSALFHSADEHQEVRSSIAQNDRVVGLRDNKHLLDESQVTARFAPYKTDRSEENNIVLSSYFTNGIDVQRNVEWQPDVTQVKPLYESVVDNGGKMVLLNDCFGDKEHMGFVQVESSINPYFQRWLSQYQYLRAHPEIDNVFVVDATDVEMLHNPFAHIEEGKLYVGDEPGSLANTWLIAHSHNAKMQQYFRSYGRSKVLLNCGVVGGSREMVMQFCRDIIDFYILGGKKDQVEMPIFNYLCYTKYSGSIVHGRQVTTVFKAFETQSDAWFKHK